MMHFYKCSELCGISQRLKLFHFEIFFLILNIHFHALFYAPSFIIVFSNGGPKLSK